MIIVPVLFIELLGLLFSSALFVLTFLTLSYIYIRHYILLGLTSNWLWFFCISLYLVKCTKCVEIHSVLHIGTVASLRVT